MTLGTTDTRITRSGTAREQQARLVAAFDDVKQYVTRQTEHHRWVSFQEAGLRRTRDGIVE
jgi:hypothetical protein